MTAPATPQAPDELEELFNDPPRLKSALEDGSFPGLVKNYTAKFNAANEETVAQFREQMQLGMQEFLRDQAAQGAGPRDGFRPGAPALSGRDGRKARAIARSRRLDASYQVEHQNLFNPAAMGASLDEEEHTGSFAEFFRAVFLDERSAKDRGDVDAVAGIQAYKKKIHNALSERVGSEGGFLVPEVLRSEILAVSIEDSVVRPRARVVPMDSLRVPLPSIDDVSHTNSVYGGVRGYWTEEGAALTQSAPSFSRVLLEAKKLTAYTAIPNELLQDSIVSLDTWFRMFFPKAIAWFEDVAFISGTGVGEPEGFLNAPSAIEITPAGGANTVTFPDVAAMYTRMWPASLNNAVWLCSPDVLAQLLQLAVTASSTGIAPPLFLEQMQAIETPGSGNGDGVNYRLMGRPLIVSEKMPSSASGNTTTAGALAFVDLSYYLLGDRQAMQIATSDEYLFANDMVAYRIIERLDGRTWLRSAITPENGSSSTLSPVVLLNTPAS